ncbi:MAG: glycine cleavage system aminomethyltransferase GcvT [Pseudomonadota bacterium]
MGEEKLKHSPLDALHRELDAKMVPFAGWDMPLNYGPGILKEHLHTRAACSVFDVSHMGPMMVQPRSDDLQVAAEALETLMPVDVAGLAEGRQRYGVLTTEDGGIIDDLMFARLEQQFYLVVNAGNAEDVIYGIAEKLNETCLAGPLKNRAMLAVQGPRAAEAMSWVAPEAEGMRFMDVREITVGPTKALVSRSGYTGEDGFEISIDADHGEPLARALTGLDFVDMAGLGARDSLRLEAGLCLYGNDIDRETSPVEAGLTWAIQKVRRRGGEREGGFPGAERILKELADGPSRRLVGLKPEGRAPVRAGATLHVGDGPEIGHVTSGVFGPTVEGPVAMGYVAAGHAAEGTALTAEVRGKRLPLTVQKLPFITPGYKR